jgi:hypothetical protein
VPLDPDGRVVRARLDSVPLDPAGRVVRARLAALRRHHPDQPGLVADEQRYLLAARLERAIQAALTGELAIDLAQREQLARLLLQGARR